MTRYILRRLLAAIPTLFAIITISFFMIRLAPGGPFDANRHVTPQVLINLQKAFHLDEPLYQQYARYLWNVLHFDFGPSFKYRDYTVAELLLTGFPISLEIGLWSLVLATLAGICLGTFAAIKRASPADQSVMALSMTGLAIPVFVTAALFQLLFSLKLHWLPVAGWDGGWRYKVLPVLTLALPNIAYIARLTRSNLTESLASDYVRTAQAKGIGIRRTVLRHALPSALLPTLAYLGPAAAATIAGSVVIEKAFAIPGVGRYFVEGAINRDYTLVMGTVILYGGLIIVANLLVDITYSLVDPRVLYH
jgi:oligopeptide transport system permease protein